MITLPLAYKGLFGHDYEIVGWRGNVLQTRHMGRIHTLSRKNTEELLTTLGLKESDIPGKQEFVIPYRPRWSITIEGDDND